MWWTIIKDDFCLGYGFGSYGLVWVNSGSYGKSEGQVVRTIGL